MSLKTLLYIKIGITVAFWAIPLLLFPPGFYAVLGMPSPEPLLFIRLLGATFVALVVGYWMGLKSLAAGESVLPVLNMGITSNGLAFCILFYFGLRRTWSAWGPFAQGYMWLSVVALLGITLGLIRFRISPPSSPRG
jgi:hypothetical protein